MRILRAKLMPLQAGLAPALGRSKHLSRPWAGTVSDSCVWNGPGSRPGQDSQLPATSNSLLRGQFGRRAEPADDQVGDLDIVLVHHQHVAVALDAETGQVQELGGPAGGIDGTDRLVADIAAFVAIGAARAFRI